VIYTCVDIDIELEVYHVVDVCHVPLAPATTIQRTGTSYGMAICGCHGVITPDSRLKGVSRVIRRSGSIVVRDEFLEIVSSKLMS
jgi:hypothetical protein